MISVCIITKDNKDKLCRTLESLRKYSLEVVVVDTGSTDGTPEMLEKWQKDAKKAFKFICGNFEWCNDFSKARNYSVSLASNDKIMIIDSDEAIDKMDLNKLERLMNNQPMSIGRIFIQDKVSQKGSDNNRIGQLSRIYNRKYYEYRGAIHEHILPIPGSPADDIDCDTSYYNAPVLIIHDGYVGTPEQLKAKSERNIMLLENELKEKGDDPYMLYQLGKSLCMLGDYAKASECFGKSLTFDLNPKLEYVADMVESYGYALLKSNQPETALNFENIFDMFGHTADFRLLMGHIYMNNRLFDEAIDMFLSATEFDAARTQGANSYLAYYNAGVIYEVLGNTREAIKLYSQCGDYEKAGERLKFLNNN